MTTAASGSTLASQSWAILNPSKKGLQYGSFCCPLAIALPIAGTCEVEIEPTIRAMLTSPLPEALP